MSTTQLPDVKEKAAEISRKIANTRPPERDKNAPEGQVTGGFNQKRDQAPAGRIPTRTAPPRGTANDRPSA